VSAAVNRDRIADAALGAAHFVRVGAGGPEQPALRVVSRDKNILAAGRREIKRAARRIKITRAREITSQENVAAAVERHALDDVGESSADLSRVTERAVGRELEEKGIEERLSVDGRKDRLARARIE